MRKLLVLGFVLTALLFLGEDAAALGTWSPTGSMGVARYSHTLTRLCDGRVLVVGGTDASGYLASAELYDPASGTWTATGSMATDRTGHSATLLANCKVLVAGGWGATGHLSSAELYDPVSGTWSPTGSMAQGRSEHTAILLSDGKVLVAAGGAPGGWDTLGLASAELYDPASGTWSPTGSLITCAGEQGGRYFALGVRLADGRVLIAGGLPQGVTFANFSSAEIYDPASGSWSCTGSMAIGRRCGFTLTLLPDGKVLVAGGVTNWTSISTDKAELYDPATGTWTPTSPLPTTRQSHSATLLPSGKVLVAGGADMPFDFPPVNIVSRAELYDPATGTWSATGSLTAPRFGHRAALLLHGRVLVAGGFAPAGPSYQSVATAELYSEDSTPPALTLTTPAEGAVYTLNQVVLADYACADEPGGSGLASCVGDVPDGAAIDTASVGPNTFTVTTEDNTGNTASLTAAYSVVYSFSGFFAPVDNTPTFNLAKAGSAIPVKFSLGGDQGLDIFATGYPKSKEISCDTSALLDAIEATVTAGSSSLSYDPIADQYVYVWKTDKAWAGTCRQLIVRLDDGTDHMANFKFK